jgi:cell division protein FtsI/penicillin-binding protein 2
MSKLTDEQVAEGLALAEVKPNRLHILNGVAWEYLTDEAKLQRLVLALHEKLQAAEAERDACAENHLAARRLVVDRNARIEAEAKRADAAEAERDEARRQAKALWARADVAEDAVVTARQQARREAFEEAASAIEGQYELIQGEGHGPDDFVVNGSATLRVCAETIRAIAEVER